MNKQLHKANICCIQQLDKYIHKAIILSMDVQENLCSES